MVEMIVSQSYWDQSYSNYKFKPLSHKNVILKEIKKHKLSQDCDSNRTVYEIGCFPGGYLHFFAKLGFRVNGSDLTSNTNTGLKKWLIESGAEVGEIYEGSFVDFPPGQFDIVCSFGFIEHFENYSAVFEEHLRRTKSGGHIIISWPNFSGDVQRRLHQFLDRDNYSNHVIEAMSFENYLDHKDISMVKFAGYLGGFDFWVDDYNQKNGLFKKSIVTLLRTISKIGRYLPNSKYYSPYSMLIIVKK